MDVVLRTYGDLEGVLATLARLAGAALSRQGDLFVFEGSQASGQGFSRDGEGDGSEDSRAGFSSGRDFLLLLPPPSLSPFLPSLTRSYGLSCEPSMGLLLCFGDLRAVRDTLQTLARLDHGRRVLYRRFDVPVQVELESLLDTLDLSDMVAVLYREDARAVVASYSAAALAHVEHALALLVEAADCPIVTYAPEYMRADDLLPLASLWARDAVCRESEPAVLPTGALVVASSRPVKLLGQLRQVDQTAQPLRLRVLIYEQRKALAGSLAFLTPLFADLHRWSLSVLFDRLRSVGVSTGRDSGASVRVVDMTLTEGRARWTNTQTDRVEGGTTATEGALVRSIEQRSVGLTVSLDGQRVGDGLRGELTFSDSVLRNDVTISVTCTADVVLVPGQVVEPCVTFSTSQALDVNVSGLSANQSGSVYRVFAWLVDDYTLPVPDPLELPELVHVSGGSTRTVATETEHLSGLVTLNLSVKQWELDDKVWLPWSPDTEWTGS